MKTSNKKYTTLSSILLMLAFILISCEKYDYRNSYSDCAESIKVRFELNENWSYAYCTEYLVYIYNPKTKCSIEVTKNRRYALDTIPYYNSRDTVFSDYKGEIWDMHDGYHITKGFRTFLNEYIYTFWFSANDSVTFENSIDQFYGLLSTLTIDSI